MEGKERVRKRKLKGLEKTKISIGGKELKRERG